LALHTPFVHLRCIFDEIHTQLHINFSVFVSYGHHLKVQKIRIGNKDKGDLNTAEKYWEADKIEKVGD